MCIETHPPNSLTRKIRSTPTKLISRGQNKTRMHEAKLDLIRHCALKLKSSTTLQNKSFAFGCFLYETFWWNIING